MYQEAKRENGKSREWEKAGKEEVSLQKAPLPVLLYYKVSPRCRYAREWSRWEAVVEAYPIMYGPLYAVKKTPRGKNHLLCYRNPRPQYPASLHATLHIRSGEFFVLPSIFFSFFFSSLSFFFLSFFFASFMSPCRRLLNLFYYGKRI